MPGCHAVRPYVSHAASHIVLHFPLLPTRAILHHPTGPAHWPTFEALVPEHLQELLPEVNESMSSPACCPHHVHTHPSHIRWWT